MATKRKKKSARAPKPTIKIERTYRTSLEEIWDLWTTSGGLESWWGPVGFLTSVRRLDVRTGGGFEYAMKAMEPARVEALKDAGLPITKVARGTYTEVTPKARIAYTTLADFIPGVAPYKVSTLVEFRQEGKDVRMVVNQDAMHDAEWTALAAIGLDQQFERLGNAIKPTEESEEENSDKTPSE